MDVVLARSKLEHLQDPMHYDHRGNENNPDKSAGDALGSANIQSGGEVCSTDGTIPPTEAGSQISVNRT